MKYIFLLITIIFTILFLSRNADVAVANTPTPPIDLVTSVNISDGQDHCFTIFESYNIGKDMMPYQKVECK